MSLDASDDCVEDRLRRVEDQLAIYQLVSAYGPAADSNNMDDLVRIWDEQCVYIVDSAAQRERDTKSPERARLRGTGIYKGHDGIKYSIEREQHQKLVAAGLAHIGSLPHVVVDGDLATATHYSTLYAYQEETFRCLRVVASRWTFVRTSEGWRVRERVSALLNGDQEARDLLAVAMKGPEQDSGIATGPSAF
jgi:hypothetical protein